MKLFGQMRQKIMKHKDVCEVLTLETKTGRDKIKTKDEFDLMSMFI